VPEDNAPLERMGLLNMKDCCMINNDRLIESFLSLGLIDGISGNERECARELISRLSALGIPATMDDAGSTFGGNAGNVRGTLPATTDGIPILLCAHMDTVQSTKNLKHVRTNGMIASDGTTILGGDDRAGLAVVLEILRTLKDHSILHGPIEILFTVCEEAGMYGAKFIQRSDFEARFGFVFDCQASPGNYIVEAPGAVAFTAVVHGRSAHAAVSPEKGIHAIQIAGKAIGQLKLGRWADTGMLNIGTIHGGTSINVIPDRVEITGETRNADEQELRSQMEYIRKTFDDTAAEFGGRVEIVFKEKYGGYRFSERDEILQIVQKSIEASGLTPTPIKYPGGSDGNVLNKSGIPTVNLGVGFKNAHSFQECVDVHDLQATAAIGLNIVKQCSQGVRS
jgi:tripeptide aminopeptidase